MSKGLNILAAAALGKAMAGDKSAEIAAGQASSDVAHAERVASLASTDREIEKIKGQNWRQYAARLRANLEARKMSESTLLEELKKANVNHPLATEVGFEQMFEKALAEQYGSLNSDPETFDDQEFERMRKSVDEGRAAVK